LRHHRLRCGSHFELPLQDNSSKGCWLFFAGSEKPTLDTPCLLLDADSDEDPEDIAAERGFPQEGLDRATIEDTTACARQFEDPPTDELLLESFVYYRRFDAWLPYPGAPDPPPSE
jgi:hypothetical protein